MRRSELLEILREVLSEQEGGAVGNVTAALGGGEGPPRVARAFSKNKAGKNAATKASEKMLGMKTVKPKKYPYSTKMIDYKKF
jgi:hypothetical protein